LTSLQLDALTVSREAWTDYHQRFSDWAGSAAYPTLVEAVYLVQERESPGPWMGASGGTRLRRWNAAAAAFEDVPWPSDLVAFEPQFRRGVSRIEVTTFAERDPGALLSRGAERLFPLPIHFDDGRTVIAPVVQGPTPDAPFDRSRLLPPRLLGFTLVRFNLLAMEQELLPTLVRRHFGAAEGVSEYLVAVVERTHPQRVVFESEPGARVAFDRPDAQMPLLTPRIRPMFFTRSRDRGAAPLAPPEAPPDALVGVLHARRDGREQLRLTRRDAPEGHWQLLVKHRAGSLEAAVATARARNVALSSGMLGLLAVAIGLIMVSARRAHGLARQQVEFVASVSHELRTPVAVIGAAAGNLADGVVGDPARVQTYGATIQAEARRLGETVERVLQLAGIAAGRAGAARVLVAPSALVASALEASRAEREQAGIAVEMTVATDLPPLYGDVAALRAAVENLTSNAVKYGGDAKWLRVSAQMVQGEPSAGAGLRRAMNVLRLWPQPQGAPATLDIVIEDRGPGIVAHDRERIFEAFYRGRDAVSQQIGGSGLGLNLVRRIADAHGGSVSVESEPGRGSTFTLRLPVAMPAVQA